MIVSIALPSASNSLSIRSRWSSGRRVSATPSATKNTTSGSIAVSAAAAITLSATSDSMNAPSPGTGCAGCSAASAAAARPGIGNASSSAGIANAVSTVPIASTAKNVSSVRRATGPARAVAIICAIPVTSSAATSGTIVICSPRSHSEPTGPAIAAAAGSAGPPDSTQPSPSPAISAAKVQPAGSLMSVTAA